MNFKFDGSQGFFIYCHKPTSLIAFSKASISVYPVSKMYFEFGSSFFALIMNSVPLMPGIR